jgi:interferon-induced GTP-binding protein Mx1
MQRDNANEYCRQLVALENIRKICGGNQLDLPQICVVGDQSSGKSSLLAEVTGINFPVSSGICTRAPIVVECKRDESISHDMYQIMLDDGNWKQVPRITDLAIDIKRLQDAGLAQRKSSSKISTREIRVCVCGPTQINIMVIDLPGIIHNGPGQAEAKSLIDNYIKKKQTLILLVSEAKQDDEGCAAIGMARAWDQDGERTLRVFTKCDTWDSRAAKERLVQRMRVQEKQCKVGLLPHAVICRMQG